MLHDHESIAGQGGRARPTLKGAVRLAAAAWLAMSVFAPQAQAAQPQKADILIVGGTVITMDAGRRIIEDGAVAVTGNRIVAVGETADIQRQFQGGTVIDARRKVVMPGLIDGHGHAGHGLVKTLGVDLDRWSWAADRMYAHGTTPAFWGAEAALSALERLKGGVTTSVMFLGGGTDTYRTDDVASANAHLEAVEKIGVRWILGVGPRPGPYPSPFTRWDGDKATEVSVGFDEQMAVTEALVRKWNKAAGGRIGMGVIYPTVRPDPSLTGPALEAVKRQATQARDLSKRYGVYFMQDGHSRGTIQFARDELGILGPDAILSHATELTEEEIRIVAETGTRIAHNPSANFSIRGRNPTTELIDAGAVVMLGSDGPAPDRSADMFRHMFQATRYHRFYFRDTTVLPAGKVLEMVTVDAAKALGLEREIGSLEAGKKADIILVDWFKPRLAPMNMPVYRMVYFANGEDVATTIVDGRILMRDRQLMTANETQVLEAAQREADAAIRRMGFEELTVAPADFWGHTKLRR